MGSIKSKSKYVLVYGRKNAGKSLFIYNLHTNITIQDIKSTEGFNYEEILIKDINLGVFDISGDIKQYELINILTKNVDLSGFIYVVNLENIDEIDKNKYYLELLYSNAYIKKGLPLFVIYNLKQYLNETLAWANTDLLDTRLGLKKLKNKYNIKAIFSCIHDCGLSISTGNDNIQILLNRIENFIDSFE